MPQLQVRDWQWLAGVLSCLRHCHCCCWPNEKARAAKLTDRRPLHPHRSEEALVAAKSRQHSRRRPVAAVAVCCQWPKAQSAPCKMCAPRRCGRTCRTRNSRGTAGGGCSRCNAAAQRLDGSSRPQARPQAATCRCQAQRRQQSLCFRPDARTCSHHYGARQKMRTPTCAWDRSKAASLPGQTQQP